jgi:ketosteroid isomerase-like protein
VYRSAGRGVAAVEFSTGGRMLATGAPFRLECISAVETKGSLISFDCEYWNLLHRRGRAGAATPRRS